jgi:integrase
MPSVKFTLIRIEQLPAPTKSGKQELYWDSSLAGFGVLCSGKSPRKVYIVQRSVGVGGAAKRRITLGSTEALTLDEARALAHGQLHSLFSGVDPREQRRKAAQEQQRNARQNITLREATTLFFEQRQSLSADVRKRWPRYLELYVPDLLGMRLKDIDAALIDERRSAIVKAVALRSAVGRPQHYVTSPGSSMGFIVGRAIAAIYNYHARRFGWAKLSLFSTPERGKVTRRTRVLLSDDMPTFWNAVSALPNQRDGTLIKVLLLTGLRHQEAAGLRWEDVRFAERKLIVPAERTKSRRELPLPLTGPLMSVLMGRRAEGVETNGFMFPAARKHIRGDGSVTEHAADLHYAFREIARRTGLVLSPHDLRRTFASVADSCDVSLLALKQLLNHSTSGDVTVGYVRVEWKRVCEAAERIAARIMELCEVPALPEAVTPLR